MKIYNVYDIIIALPRVRIIAVYDSGGNKWM